MQCSVIIGSDSDWKIARETCKILKEFNVTYEVHVFSAHRSPVELINHINHCEEECCGVYICAAGKAAHLAGVVAAHTMQPVIGIPIGNALNGLDSLLSTVQMPPGVPVATVAIDGGVNAAILAVQMLSLSDASFRLKLQDYRSRLRDSVLAKDLVVQKWAESEIHSAPT